MVVGILQPSYLPWLGFFQQIDYCDVFVLYDDVQFEKGSWRNRNRIIGKNDTIWLTVPVLTKGLGPQSLQEVKINNREKWKKRHKTSIGQCYSKTPYYSQYWPTTGHARFDGRHTRRQPA